VIDLRAHTQPPGERRRANRGDHEFLEIDVVVGVGPAVQHVHERDRNHVRGRAAEVTEQRQPVRVGGGTRQRHRNPEHGVGAEARLVVGAVEVEHHAIDGPLVVAVLVQQCRSDHLVDVADGVQDALAAVALAAVA
jgi:hypothetical protein